MISTISFCIMYFCLKQWIMRILRPNLNRGISEIRWIVCEKVSLYSPDFSLLSIFLLPQITYYKRPCEKIKRSYIRHWILLLTKNFLKCRVAILWLCCSLHLRPITQRCIRRRQLRSLKLHVHRSVRQSNVKLTTNVPNAWDLVNTLAPIRMELIAPLTNQYVRKKVYK